MGGFMWRDSRIKKQVLCNKYEFQASNGCGGVKAVKKCRISSKFIGLILWTFFYMFAACLTMTERQRKSPRKPFLRF